MPADLLNKFYTAITAIANRGDAREESYYSTLEALFEGYAAQTGRKGFDVRTLPKKTEAGNPDFRIWDGSNQITGYIEAKDPSNTNLDAVEESEQLKRYRNTFPNLILTNFFEFRLYRNGDLFETATTCLMRVNGTTTSFADTSAAAFTITAEPNYITLTSPNGGETWAEQSTHDITWNMSGDVGSYVSLNYSTDGVTTWNQIISSTANDGTHSWTLPNLFETSTTCRVKVASTTTAFIDSSDADFTIIDEDYILLTAPNGGEEFLEETVQTISWDYSAGSGANVTLDYSTDGGTTWTQFVSSTANDGTYDWTLPDITQVQNTCRVKVSTTTGVYSDESDSDFRIIWSPGLLGSYDTPGSAKSLFISGNYAYVADTDGDLQIINISSKSSPTFSGSISLSSTAQDVYVDGSYAYLAHGSGGLQIVNVSNPISPSSTGSYPSSDFSRGVYKYGNYVYLADHFGGLRIINVSNPSSPSLTGSIDVQTQAWDVFVSGNYAYVPEYTYGYLRIINIGNPSSPTLTASYEAGIADVMDVFVVGNNAYLAAYDEGLHILDISNPSNPVLLGSCDTPDRAEGVFISGNYAFIADRYSGLRIIDISNTSSPITIGSVDTPDFARRVIVSGNYAYVADGGSGLLIFDVSGLP